MYFVPRMPTSKSKFASESIVVVLAIIEDETVFLSSRRTETLVNVICFLFSRAKFWIAGVSTSQRDILLSFKLDHYAKGDEHRNI